jgi:hypothetical protein
MKHEFQECFNLIIRCFEAKAQTMHQNICHNYMKIKFAFNVENLDCKRARLQNKYQI